MTRRMCASPGGGVASQISMMMVRQFSYSILTPTTVLFSGIWEWPEGGRANFTNWHDAAVPNHENYNCMQLLSATCYGKLETINTEDIEQPIIYIQMDDG